MQYNFLANRRNKKNNFFNYFKFVLIFSIFILPGCVTHKIYGNDTLKNPNSPYTKPLPYYLKELEKKDGEEKNRAAINAAGRLIEEGRIKESKKILRQTKSQEKTIEAEKKILNAKANLLDERPKEAIRELLQVQDVDNLTAYYQSQYHLTLAKAYQLSGRKEDAIKERITLNNLKLDANTKMQNLHDTWLVLSSLQTQEIESLLSFAGGNTEFKGWLDLNLLARANLNDVSLHSAIFKWQKQYPDHDAIKILTLNNQTSAFNTPKKIALLLPMTGSLQGPGNAIYDGFMKAFSEDAKKEKIDLLVFNTDAQNIESLYDYVVKNGADYVVGPLQKSNVVKVAQMHHPVPTIILNDYAKTGINNLFHFGLSPTSEAREVAKKAVTKGSRKALVIAPTGDWGNDVVQAFKEEWLKHGGTIEDTLRYDNKISLNTALKDFLDVTASEQRGKTIKKLLGKKVEVIGNRRQDFDMIFLLAYPEKGRQIMPLLNYYYAADIPVYATSNIYSGNANPLKDRDLNGVIFCDMPWVFNYQMSNKNWPEQFNSYNRLYALGMDSYYLVQQLNKLMLFPAVDMQKNGVVYLNEQKRLARVMAWGQFQQGVPKMLN